MFRAIRVATDAACADHETAFIERYDRLHARAMRLTGDREQADDLVQDAFVQFVIARTPLHEIANLEAYLFTMLRYLHASDVRRAVRRRGDSLDLVDHDSADLALRASDVADRYQACEELRLICEHACARCTTSKAATALLLRYFHGYSVREIAEVLQSPPAGVDGLLHSARSEARACVTPGGPGRKVAEGRPRTASPTTRRGCLDELRAEIFARAHGRCFPPQWFEDVYGPGPRRQASAAELAEIATCFDCLDAVNGVLDLPRLADRYPTDSLGPDRRSDGSNRRPGPDGRGNAGPSDVARPGPKPRGDRVAGWLKRAALEVGEHRPRALTVSVNGLELASHRTVGVVDEQQVTVSGGEAIGFVEVFSDQQVRMLFLEVQPPPDGAIRQSRRVELSDGRTLEATVDFADRWPTIHVRYRDPQAVAAASEVEPEAARDRTLDVHRQHAPDQRSTPSEGAHSVLGLRAWLLRPRAVPVALVLVALTLSAYFALRGPERLTASELMTRAIATEQAANGLAAGIQHRVLQLEERDAENGALVGLTRIEVWKDVARGMSARRTFDARTGRLAALELSVGPAASTVYRPTVPPRRLSGEDARPVAVLGADEPWRLDLSAGYFINLLSGLPGGTVEPTAAGYLVRTHSRRADTPGRILEAALTFARSDYRLVTVVLVVRQSSGVREYRLTETPGDKPSSRPAVGNPFEPDPGLILGDGAPGAGSPPVPPDAHARPDAQELAALQVEALLLLDQVGATLGEQVDVTRGPAGLVVAALVEGQTRRQQLLRALAPLVGNPLVRLEIRTLRDVGRRSDRAGLPTLVQGVDATRDRVAVHDEARAYVLAHADPAWPADGPDREDRVEREIARIGAHALARARRALQHAWALERLTRQVPPEMAATLEPGAQAWWRTMLRGHANACRQETVQLRGELGGIFGRTASSLSPDVERRSGDLTAAVKDLLAAAVAQDEAVRSTFAVPTGAAAPVVTPAQTEFWDVILRVESLAGRLGEWK
jgi:RNA polymerase sigma factor (sigma-70 family)